MKRLALTLILLINTDLLADADHVMVHQSEKPAHIENPILILDNFKPPFIRIDIGNPTWVTFPREIYTCSMGTKNFTIARIGPTGEAVTTKEQKSVRKIQILANPEALRQTKTLMDAAGGGSVFDLPNNRVMCLFVNGDIRFLKVVLSRQAYATVELIEKSDDPSRFDAFRASEMAPVKKVREEEDGIELIPMYREFEEDNGPVIIRHIDDGKVGIDDLPFEDEDFKLPAESEPKQDDKDSKDKPKVMISENGGQSD